MAAVTMGSFWSAIHASRSACSASAPYRSPAHSHTALAVSPEHAFPLRTSEMNPVVSPRARASAAASPRFLANSLSSSVENFMSGLQ